MAELHVQRKRNKTWLVLLILFLIIIAAIVIYYAYTHGYISTGNNTNAVSTITTPHAPGVGMLTMICQ
jgi:hypothetical protein